MPESNRMFDLITPFIEEVQDIETMLNDLREVRDVDNAEGLQLEGVGDIVDLPRPAGMNDDDYRAALRLKNTLNLSAGQPELLIAFAKDFTGAAVEYREPWPGYFVFYTNASCDFTRLRQNLKALAPVGVGFDIIYVNPAVNTFNFADEGGFSSPGYGFLELDYPEAENSYTAGCLTELY
jgi:hypothetical protein